MQSVSKLTWEEAVLRFRQDASHQLIKHCYFHENVEDAAIEFESSEEFRLTKKILAGKSGKLLDVGAGNGMASFAFARLGYDVYALEPDKSNVVGSGAIELLNQKFDTKIKVSNEVGEKLPYPNNYFDVIYCRQVLHHAQNLSQFMNELARVLKPGGFLFTLRDHVISKKEDLDLFLNRHPLHKYYGGENAFLLMEYLEAFEKANLKLRKTYYPLSSSLNFFPEPLDKVKMKIRGLVKGHITWWKYYLSIFIPAEWIVKLLGEFASQKMDDPGRLYSFLLTKY